jgi:hypothetical protein
MDEDNQEDFLNLNFFALLFDAFKLFPSFKLSMQTYHQREKDAWIQVIRNAKESGEIRSALTDEQIAQIFLFTSDGLTMNLTMDNNTAGLNHKLSELWDNFYVTLKA